MAFEARILPFIDEQVYITAEYGKYPSGGVHKGIDLSNSKNSNVYSIVKGVVTDKGWQPSGFGNYIVLKDSQTGQGFLYGHMKEASPLTVGDTVDYGTFCGIEGTTGNSTGIHLHIESQDMSNRTNWQFGLPLNQTLNPTLYMGFPNQLGLAVIYNGDVPQPPTPIFKKKRFPFFLYKKRR